METVTVCACVAWCTRDCYLRYVECDGAAVGDDARSQPKELHIRPKPVCRSLQKPAGGTKYAHRDFLQSVFERIPCVDVGRRCFAVDKDAESYVDRAERMAAGKERTPPRRQMKEASTPRLSRGGSGASVRGTAAGVGIDECGVQDS